MIKVLAVALAMAALLAPAALASDPGAALTADLQKLSSDRGTMHAAVMSDLQKLTADVQSSTSKASLEKAVKVDVASLESDASTNHEVLQADRQQALADY